MPTYLGTADPIAYRNGGTCSQCGRADRLVGLEFVIEYDGSVALCVGCIADLALAAGYLITEDGARRLHEAEARAAAAEERADEAERTVEQLHASWSRVKARRAKESA